MYTVTIVEIEITIKRKLIAPIVHPSMIAILFDGSVSKKINYDTIKHYNLITCHIAIIFYKNIVSYMYIYIYIPSHESANGTIILLSMQS